MRVYALYGSSGSGKSHRASLLAMELGCNLILDDGLLIGDNKILAGNSAKKERSKLAAVRRAIFSMPRDVEKMKQVLRQYEEANLLLIGTSRHMIDRIVVSLALPEPEKYIAIEEIATDSEIKHARKVRKDQGKHVIPAPTVEVRKTFSGYLVDPLRLFAHRGNNREMLIEKSVVRPTWSYLGRFTVEETVVSTIAALTAKKVPGVGRVRKVNVEAKPYGVEIRLQIIVHYGAVLPDVLHTLQVKIKDMIEYMTSLNVLAVHVVVKRLSVSR